MTEPDPRPDPARAWASEHYGSDDQPGPAAPVRQPGGAPTSAPGARNRLRTLAVGAVLTGVLVVGAGLGGAALAAASGGDDAPGGGGGAGVGDVFDGGGPGDGPGDGPEGGPGGGGAGGGR